MYKCNAESLDGITCTLPQGHKGNHQGLYKGMKAAWKEPKSVREEKYNSAPHMYNKNFIYRRENYKKAEVKIGSDGRQRYLIKSNGDIEKG